MRYTGVTSRGIIMPMFKEGDDLINMVAENLLKAAENEGFELHDRDVVGVTESVLARTQGNYATIEQIAEDVRRKFNGGELGIVFPILSRNRFAIMLKAFSMASKRLFVQLSFPSDEVGNQLISWEDLDRSTADTKSSMNENQFRATFGYDTKHPFTGIDYIEYYKSLGDNIEIIFSNDPCYILKYTKNVINCDIHTRYRTSAQLLESGAEKVYRMDQIMNEPINGSGFNDQYGLLGANKATEDKVKLFPRECKEFCLMLQAAIKKISGKNLEIMIYGDGGFKDPVGGIWELADPVVSPGYTDGLKGTPNELKMKYFADNELKDLQGPELADAMRKKIREKDSNLVGSMNSEGTTPRQLTDLLGSLCDLTSGSGDRGTPVVLIQNYFTNYATE